MARQPKNAPHSTGGQYAPSTAGKTNIPTSSAPLPQKPKTTHGIFHTWKLKRETRTILMKIDYWIYTTHSSKNNPYNIEDIIYHPKRKVRLAAARSHILPAPHMRTLTHDVDDKVASTAVTTLQDREAIRLKWQIAYEKLTREQRLFHDIRYERNHNEWVKKAEQATWTIPPYDEDGLNYAASTDTSYWDNATKKKKR